MHEDSIRFWMDRELPLRSWDSIDDYVDDMGIVQLFGGNDPCMPSLREVTYDDDVEHDNSGWGPDLELLWSYKDERAASGAIWLGRFVKARQIIMSREFFDLLYPYPGSPQDYHLERSLSRQAVSVCALLERSGPLTSGRIRAELGLTSHTAKSASDELFRNLLLTNVGVTSGANGWDANLLDLSWRLVSEERLVQDERDLRVVDKLNAASHEMTPSHLKSILRWDRPRVLRALKAGQIQ